MSRKLRIFLAVVLFTTLALSFLDVSGLLSPKLAFLAQWQLVPALVAGHVAVVIGVLVLTVIFGRLYCSVICPLGVTQDLLAHLGRKNRFKPTSARTILRLAVLVLFIAAFLIGWPIIFGLLEPYSAFGRLAATLLKPVWATGSNVLAWASARADNFAVGPSAIWISGLTPLIASVVTLVVLAFLSYKSGRTWCNSLCPVGTVLGFFSRFSLIRPRFVLEKCIHCSRCEKVCKSGCLDSKTATLDASRCVSCFNCLAVCRQKALTLWPLKVPNSATSLPGSTARRAFLVGALSLFSYPAVAQQVTTNRPARSLSRKIPHDRPVPITPPGSGSVTAYETRCTGCLLCVSSCPNQALRAQDHGSTRLQPTLFFERGYCRVNCVVCSEVCPTGAIRPISVAVKSSTQIGLAKIELSQCIINTDDVPCTACFRNCPPAAITMVDGPKHQLPVVDQERCIGCGACEYNCPVRPRAAIWVEGHLTHRSI